MTYYIGVDIGTSSAKLLLMDALGNVCRKQEEHYSLAQPHPGWLEIDPGHWFLAAIAGLKLLLTGIDRRALRGIGFTGQMHTTIFLDEAGNSIRPAISWNDTRTADPAQRLRQRICAHGDHRHIAEILSTGSPAANLLWLKENEPENFARLQTVLIGPDYLTYRFTGVYATDYCEASTSSLYRMDTHSWSAPMLALVGLDETTVPRVFGAGQIVGSILPEIARELGLPMDVQVIAGTGDNPATYVSSGQLKSGEPMISLGTSGILMSSRPLDAGAKGKQILFSVDASTFHVIVQGAVQSTGSSFRWWAKDILRSDDYDAVSDLVDITQPVNLKLLFYPHLNGDKTIYADPHLKGAFIGIGTESTRGELTRAMMEGISFAFRQLMEQMNVGEGVHTIKVAGGMSRMASFMQLMADILKVRIAVAPGTGAAQGAAWLAAKGCGNDITQRADARQGLVEFYPRGAYLPAYDDKYNR